MVQDKGSIKSGHVRETLDQLDKILSGEYRGLTFGWGSAVDDRTLGLEPENLVVVAGETGAGKTTHAINTTYHNIHDGKRVLFVTSEISAKWINMRLAARSVGLSLRDIKTRGALLPDQIGDVRKAIQELDTLPLHVMDTPYPVYEEVLDSVERHTPELLIVDYFQRLNPNNDNTPVGYRTYAQNFKRMAVERKIPVMLLSQPRLTDGWFEYKDGEFIYNFHLMGTTWTTELHNEADKVLYLHNLERRIPSMKGVGHVIYHKMRDTDGGGFTELKLAYDKTFVGSEMMYSIECGGEIPK